MMEPQAALMRAVDRWNAGDLDGYLELYDPAIQLHGYSPEPMDIAAVRAFYQNVWTALGDVGRSGPRLEIHDAISEGDRLACRFTMSGIHRGPFLGVAATGRPYALNGITMMAFRAGRVVERWSSADMLGLMVQIGALPSPG